jgi:hypothetical protein
MDAKEIGIEGSASNNDKVAFQRQTVEGNILFLALLLSVRPMADAIRPLNPCLHPRPCGHALPKTCIEASAERGCPLAHRTHKPFLLCRQWNLKASPPDATPFGNVLQGPTYA